MKFSVYLPQPPKAIYADSEKQTMLIKHSLFLLMPAILFIKAVKGYCGYPSVSSASNLPIRLAM